MTAIRSRFLRTPVGRAVAVAVDDRLVALEVGDEPEEFVLVRFAELLGAFPEPCDDSLLRAVDGQLQDYFAGSRRRFDIPLDWRLVQGLHRSALQAVCDIPYAETASYGEVAVRAGAPGAARAVGTACARSPFSLVVPVHRVVRADGSIGEYGGRPGVKRFLLDLERDTAARS